MIDVPIYIDYIALAPAKARARKTDPSTSHDAAASVTLDTMNEQHAAIYSLLKINGPSTVKELTKWLCLNSHQIGRRIGEIRGIQPTGEVRGKCRVWGLIN
jgi:predicted HTH transcriptional regulator